MFMIKITWDTLLKHIEFTRYACNVDIRVIVAYSARVLLISSHLSFFFARYIYSKSQRFLMVS